nr:DUF393 domain-containing protein [Nakamurella aerolata]
MFDGDCGFCTTSAQFTRRWIDRKHRFDIEPFQNFSPAQLAGWNLDYQRCGESLHFVAGTGHRRSGQPERQHPDRPDTDRATVDATGAGTGRSGRTKTYAGAAAVAATLRAGAVGWRPAGLVLAAPGISWLAERGYRWVAAHRYRLPGGTPACAVDLSARNSASRPQPPPTGTGQPTGGQLRADTQPPTG